MRRKPVKKCNGGCPCPESSCSRNPSERESFWTSEWVSRRFFRAPLLRAPLQKHGLKGKIQTAAEHSEIIFRPIDHSEAQVINHCDVPREPKFETGAELTEHFGFAAEMFGLRIDSECVRRSLRVKGVPFAAAENRTHTRPCVRRKTCAGNWIPQRKCAKDSADGMIMIDSSVNKNRNRLVLEDIETRLAGVQSKSFNTETSIATEEIFYVPAAAPCVVATDVAIIGAKDWASFTRTLHDVHQRRIRSEFGVGECICAPEVHVPFAIAIPFGTWWRRDLFNFFSRFAIGIRNIGVVTEPRGHGRFGFGVFATEEPGKGHKDISHRRIVCATKQR